MTGGGAAAQFPPLAGVRSCDRWRLRCHRIVKSLKRSKPSVFILSGDARFRSTPTSSPVGVTSLQSLPSSHRPPPVPEAASAPSLVSPNTSLDQCRLSSAVGRYLQRYLSQQLLKLQPLKLTTRGRNQPSQYETTVILWSTMIFPSITILRYTISHIIPNN